MTFTVHVYHHHEDLTLIVEQLRNIIHQETRIMASLDALTAQVAESKAVEQSALLLIQGIADKLEEAGTDPEKLAALTAELKESSDALAAAVIANTA